MEVNQIYTGDCVELLTRLEPATVDLAFADPPFNIGYEYDRYDDRQDRSAYLQFCERWLAGLRRVLSPHGSLYVAIGDEYAAEMKLLIDRTGLHMRNWIIWHYTFGVHCQQKFTRSHVHIFYYTAHPKDFTFNASACRVPSARQTRYKDKRANPLGRIPDDTWVLRPEAELAAFAASSDTWSISRVCGTFGERRQHPCQMPEAVLERIIATSSNAGDLVLDPFAGSGTTLAVAKRLQRRYLGFELSADYSRAIRERLADAVEIQLVSGAR